MFIVGLTGGIGSGKSAVADCFRQLGITVVDADIAARRVVEKGTSALAAIADHFGRDILLSDGTLDRAALRHRIFDNGEDKAWLEGLLHPLINQWIQDQLAAAPGPYAVLETPLLLESGQRRLVHRILVVDVPEATQLARASQRDGNSEAQIRAIMAAQLGREERLAGADDVIDNSGDLDTLKQQVQALHQNYLQLASAQP